MKFNGTRREFGLAGCIVAAGLMTGCAPSRGSGPAPSQAPQDPPEPVFREVGGQADVQDTALFLAGLPVRSGERLSTLQQSAEYQLHYREMRENWNLLGRRRVARMTEWSQQNIQPVTRGADCLLYPFGGPDQLYSEALFPHVGRKLLLGLEPVGEIPLLESLDTASILAALPAYRQTTSTQLRVGYFITKDMRKEVGSRFVSGVAPIIMGSIALAGGEVLSVVPVRAAGRSALDVTYRNAYGQRTKLTYVSADLSNSGFDGGYSDWLRAQGADAAYFKAASYLMHDGNFSKLRSFVLGQTRSVLQDDSGIPFKQFGPEWQIRLYGNYQGPIELFSKFSQPDLRTAYAASPRPPLNFGSGYHYNPATANLMLAFKG